MPAMLLLFVLLLAGCVPGAGRAASDGVPTADVPFTLTALDVGQGDALLLRTTEATVLVDTGEPSAGLVRLLKREGVARLDLLVITHAHLDHIGGAPELLDAIPVDVIWMHPVPADIAAVAQYEAVLRRAMASGTAVRAPPEGARIAIGDLLLEVLGPPPGRPYAWTRSELNNGSIVLRASVAGVGSVLIAGDTEREAQATLLATHLARLRADVLVVPHHGSRTTDPAFLAAVGASTAVINVGRANRHGHPHADVLAALDVLGIEVLRTDLHGTIRHPVGHRVSVARSPGRAASSG